MKVIARGEGGVLLEKGDLPEDVTVRLCYWVGLIEWAKAENFLKGIEVYGFGLKRWEEKRRKAVYVPRQTLYEQFFEAYPPLFLQMFRLINKGHADFHFTLDMCLLNASGSRAVTSFRVIIKALRLL